MASPDGQAGSVKIHADAKLYSGLFDGEQATQIALNPQRKAYVHLIRGSLNVNGQTLSGGDALLIDNERLLTMDQGRDAEVLLFDLSP